MTTSTPVRARQRAEAQTEQHTGGTLSRTILRPFNSSLSSCLGLAPRPVEAGINRLICHSVDGAEGGPA